MTKAPPSWALATALACAALAAAQLLPGALACNDPEVVCPGSAPMCGVFPELNLQWCIDSVRAGRLSPSASSVCTGARARHARRCWSTDLACPMDGREPHSLRSPSVPPTNSAGTARTRAAKSWPSATSFSASELGQVLRSVEQAGAAAGWPPGHIVTFTYCPC